MKFLNYLLLLSVSCTLLSCSETRNEPIEHDVLTSENKEKKVIKIGIVPQFSPKRILSIWSPIIDELEKETGFTFQIIGTATIPEFEKEYQKGTFDVAYMNPYHAIDAYKKQGYEAVLKDGSRSLFGILVVKKEDEIQSISELNGSKISFPAPNALGASLLMRTELKTLHNIDFEPIYVETHTNSYLSVLEEKTRAGGGVMRTFNELSEDIRSQLRIFYQTKKTPSHPIVIHQRVEEEDREKIVAALLKIGEDKSMKEYLKKVPIKKIIKTSQEEYEVLEELGVEDFYINPNQIEKY